LCYRLIPRSILRVEMKTNLDTSFPTAVYCDLSPIDTDSGIVYAAAVLLGLYVLIVLEVSCIAYSSVHEAQIEHCQHSKTHNSS
jgi:hypothetical protein